jgi:hypothetical protein
VALPPTIGESPPFGLSVEPPLDPPLPEPPPPPQLLMAAQSARIRTAATIRKEPARRVRRNAAGNSHKLEW